MINSILEKCGCIGNSTSISAFIHIENLDIEEVFPPNQIKILVSLKFNLNCTSFKPGDCIILQEKQEKNSDKLLNEDINPEYLIKIRGISLSYEGSTQSSFVLTPNIYSFKYIRPVLKYDENKTYWKTLGSSAYFKIDLEENNTATHKQKTKSFSTTPNKTLDSTKLLCESNNKKEWRPLKKDILDEEETDSFFEDNNSIAVDINNEKEKENHIVIPQWSQNKMNKRTKPKKVMNFQGEMDDIQIQNFFKEIEKRKKDEIPLTERKMESKIIAQIRKKKLESPLKIGKNRNKFLK